MEIPEIPAGIAPGTDLVVVAGQQRYTLTDSTGQELGIEARDNPSVIAFVHAFDEWLTVDGAMGQDAPATIAAWANVRARWERLPRYLRNDFPSSRRGIIVPGGHR